MIELLKKQRYDGFPDWIKFTVLLQCQVKNEVDKCRDCDHCNNCHLLKHGNYFPRLKDDIIKEAS